MNDATREVQLTDAQAKYLGEKIELPKSLADVVGEPPRRAFRLTSAQQGMFVSILSDKLQRCGFDAGYKPTVDGSMLESLIDALTGASA